MIQRLRDVLVTPEETPNVPREHTEYVDKSELKGLAIEVDMNVKNVDYNLSRCCNPQPGDPIFAFVSVLKGIRIHRCDCPNAQDIRDRYPYRVLPARWAKKS
jgi:GTP pyrophosphokinase